MEEFDSRKMKKICEKCYKNKKRDGKTNGEMCAGESSKFKEYGYISKKCLNCSHWG